MSAVRAGTEAAAADEVVSSAILLVLCAAFSAEWEFRDTTFGNEALILEISAQITSVIFRVNIFVRHFHSVKRRSKQAKMMKTVVISILSLLLPPAALASNPFVPLGLNEDFVRLDKHAHDAARLRRISADNANANKPILRTEEESTNVQPDGPQ